MKYDNTNYPDETLQIVNNEFQLNVIIVTRKEIAWLHGPLSKNFQNMSTIVGWSFTEGTDLF